MADRRAARGTQRGKWPLSKQVEGTGSLCRGPVSGAQGRKGRNGAEGLAHWVLGAGVRSRREPRGVCEHRAEPCEEDRRKEEAGGLAVSQEAVVNAGGGTQTGAEAGEDRAV